MRKKIRTTLAIPFLLGLLPAAALADDPVTCGEDYRDQLSPAQQEFLVSQNIDIQVPDGEVAVIQRCDTNGDNMVDILDIRAIALNRNQPASDPDDPMDWDRNGLVNLLDVRGCQLACSYARCAVLPNEPPELVGGVTAPAECFQKEDLDGDGEVDFVAVAENTEEEVGEGYNLKVVILSKNANEEVELVTFPYTGQSASETGGVITQHLSVQDPGVVNLNPGSLPLTKPGIVSYRNGKPHVVYYFVDGQVRRAYYGIDD